MAGLYYEQFFVGQEFDHEVVVRLGRAIDYRHVERSIGQAPEQPRGVIDLGAQRDVGGVLLHPGEPVAQDRVPEARLGAGNRHRAPAGWQSDLALRAFPDLDEVRRGLPKALACRGQPRARLVADEKLLAEARFERSNPRADRGLCYV